MAARAVCVQNGVTWLYDVSHCLLLVHTPSSAFPHGLPPRKDVVKQCLEFVSGLLGHRVCARFSFRFMMMWGLMSSDVGLTYLGTTLSVHMSGRYVVTGGVAQSH